MGSLEQLLHDIGVFLSRVLEPVTVGIDLVNNTVGRQMAAVGITVAWQGTVMDVLWGVVTFMVLRTLTGWARLVVLVLATLVLAKVYGLLPSV